MCRVAGVAGPAAGRTLRHAEVGVVDPTAAPSLWKGEVLGEVHSLLQADQAAVHTQAGTPGCTRQ